MNVNNRQLKMMIFMISCLSLSLTYAKDKKTEYSYSKFCDQANGAEGQATVQLNKLNKKSAETIELIKEKTNKLNAIKAKRIILDDLNSMKNEFIESIVPMGEKEISKETVKNFSDAYSKTLNMEAFRLLINDHSLKNKLFSTDQICAEGGDKTKVFCKSLAENPRTKIALDNSLASFGSMYEKTDPNDSEFTGAMKGIFSSLKLSTEVLLSLLSGSEHKDTLIGKNELDQSSPNSCMDYNDENKRTDDNFIKCKTFLNLKSHDPKFRQAYESIKSSLDKDSSGKTRTGNLTKKDKLFYEIFNKEFDIKFYNTSIFNLHSDKELSAILDSTKKQVDSVQVLDQKIGLYSKFKSYLTPEKRTALGIVSEMEEFDKTCIPTLESTLEVKITKTDICKKSLMKVVEKFNEVDGKKVALKDQIADLKKEENKLTDEIHNLISDNGILSGIEKFKSFILKKAKANCPKFSGTSLFEIPTCQALLNEPKVSTEEVRSLADTVRQVMQRFKDKFSPDKKNGEFGLFSKTELGELVDECNRNEAIKNEFKDSCEEASSDFLSIRDKKETAERITENQKYILEHNPRSRAGYDKFERKSNLRILGEGALQVVPSLIPMWITNMQMEYQIDAMTQDAINRKQFLYMNSFDSPWAQYNPYFQGSFFNFNNTSVNTTNPVVTPTTGVVNGGFSF